MTHRIIAVKALDDSTISAVFQNGIEKEYNMRKLYPEFPKFREFETNTELFKLVKVDTGGYGISWNDDLDLCAEDIWDDGVETGDKCEVEICQLLAVNLIKARDDSGMTQKQLSEATGIYQADISKIERGLSNPSVLTLKRLADGLGMKLSIEFISNEENRP